ncbi:hypothetical protein POM88_007237 [Heracleum sosnowskyi]|uniref:DUF8039 domain-containing protein n=1 Tax=Heracleum sosnowskyi TaxID=360622 RepID=A0AAD8J4A6_9APIA|nr:hypothetical protein POM88_007237 [Heracleum sosnowskyi]
MERTRQEMERTREEMVQALKAMGIANFPSPKLSEMASCGQKVASPSVVKDLDQLLVDDDDCVPIKPIRKQGSAKIFIHGVPMQPGFAHVSVDGPIKGDALIPVPVVGEIEIVDQAVGSHVSWSRDLIIINAPSDAFKMIGQAIISSYMAYLHSKVHENDNLDLFAFCDPGATFTLNNEFEAYLFNHLKEGNPDRLFLLPHNTN